MSSYKFLYPYEYDFEIFYWYYYSFGAVDPLLPWVAHL